MMQVKNLQLVKLFSNFILDTLLAPVCLTCEQERIHINEFLCSECESQILPFSALKLSIFQKELMKNQIYEPTFVGFQFNSIMKKVIHLLKYKRCSRLGGYIGEALGRRLKQEGLKDFDYIIPVPLHPRREKERGYNQSYLIACGVSSVLNIPVLDKAILRIRYTSSQALLKREERLDNLDGAFQINPVCHNQLQNAHILLIDDLITTGTTIREINKILGDYGCTSILNCAVASSTD